MVVFKNKTYTRCADYPNTDFTGCADYVLDDNTQTELEDKIISLYPNYGFVFDGDGRLIDVTPTNPVPVPPAPPTNAELAAAVAELAEIVMGGMMA